MARPDDWFDWARRQMEEEDEVQMGEPVRTQILSCLDTRKAHGQNLCSDTGVCWQKFFTV